MLYLLLVSIIWSLSFGLVKVSFAGIDGNLLATLRLALAIPLFLPFLPRNKLPDLRIICCLVAIGAVQYGIMYACLFNSFRYLAGYEVALLTVLTPLYVVLIDSVWNQKWRASVFLSALMAVLGGFLLYNVSRSPGSWTGIALMQISNLSFALGQVAYRQIHAKIQPLKDRQVFAFLYLGGFTVAFLSTILFGNLVQITELTIPQWAALIYLGTIASGLCFFWWNVGATQVSAGLLAVFNNIKIPLAVIFALTLFGESAPWLNLTLGTLLMAIAFGLAHQSK